MKNILVLYYSQTGQLKDILESITKTIGSDQGCEVHFGEIKMAIPYPFPWTAVEFFDTFPETVQGIPQEIILPEIDENVNYDLIILGYQTWYMSPSIPMNSFLHSEPARKILENKPVVTVIGSRNMWLVGQEKMKRKLSELNARLIGNIAMVDKTPNLIGLFTVLGWMLKGKKKNFLGFLPPSGVSDKDISDAEKFGPIILKHLNDDSLNSLQRELVEQGAVAIDPKLLQLEIRANRLFGMWSKFMLAKGGPGNPARRVRAKVLLFLIPLGALILAPLSALLAILSGLVNRRKMKKIKEQFTGVEQVIV